MIFRRKAAILMAGFLAAAGLGTAVALPASASPPPGNYFSILNGGGTQMCLQPAGAADSAGTAIVQEPCDINGANPAQHWAPIIIGGSTIELVNQATGMCLDARGGAARGTPIDQWPCNTISNEHWSWPHGFPDGFWPLGSQVAGSSGFCLDEPGADRFTAGLAMQLYTCNGTSAQAWGIVK